MYLRSELAQIKFPSELFARLKGSRVALIGGTGFIGSWIISALEFLAFSKSLEFDVIVYTRNVAAAQKKFNFIQNIKLKFEQVDFTLNPLTQIASADFYICGGTPSNSATGNRDNLKSYQATINSIKSVVNSLNKQYPTILNLSSGAVFKHSTYNVNPIEDSSEVEINPPNYSYQAGKIHSEELVVKAFEDKLAQGANLRLFAFYGPGIKLDEHFAIGNFLGDALTNKKIVIKGNPNTIRSYMHPVDLCSYLFHALNAPTNSSLNIGSEAPITMWDLATTISELTNHCPVEIENSEASPSSYWPKMNSAVKSYGSLSAIEFREGIGNWIRWLKSGA
jgi:nucleoside-diphosphate-sugar epimerase